MDRSRLDALNDLHLAHTGLARRHFDRRYLDLRTTQGAPERPPFAAAAEDESALRLDRHPPDELPSLVAIFREDGGRLTGERMKRG
jgi:hypothetical protein